MPDYIYLLEHRLSVDQRNALNQLRDAARESSMLLFLTGDAVRDLTSGQAVRDLEVAVHGNALKLKKIVEKMGGKVWGEDEASRSLYLCFPGTVRVDLISAHRREYPKPGKPVFHPASIQEDLRRRDFTVNAMAISLNEGSFGLLMDPLNGAADIEARTLRLVSNYGFLEEPTLLIRATRYLARLGWDLDPKTLTRYENAKAESVIESLSMHARSQELEQIGHEEDGLKIVRALEAEGWMNALFPAWTAAKADEDKLKTLHELSVSLQMQGVHPDLSAAQMQLLTAKLAAKDLSALKKLMLRPGFVEEWNSLDSLASGFAKVLLAKENATPSTSYKIFTSYDPESVLWLGFTSKDQAVKDRFELFVKTWPESRQRIPHTLMQEMRITPELATYNEIVRKVFLELIDGRLTTPEEIKAFLEPFSPPAPPPQVTIKRTRAKRGAEPKIKEKSFDDDEDSEDGDDEDEDVNDVGGDDEEADLGLSIPKINLEPDPADESESDEEDSEDDEPEPPKRPGKQPIAAKPGKAEAEVGEAKSVGQKTPSAKSAKAEKVMAESKPAPAAIAKGKPEPIAKAEVKPAPKPASLKAAPAAVKATTVANKSGSAATAKAPSAAHKPAPMGKSHSAKSTPSNHTVKGPAKPAPKVQVKGVVKAHPKPVVKTKAAPAPKKLALRAKGAKSHPPAKPHAPAKPVKSAAKKTSGKPSKKR